MPATKNRKTPAPVLVFSRREAPIDASLQLDVDFKRLESISSAPPANARWRREVVSFVNSLQTILLIDPDAIYQFSGLAEAAIEEMQEDGRLPWEKQR